MDTAAQRSARASLRKTTNVHEALVGHVLRVEKRNDDEATLCWLSIAVGLARLAHPGRFVDDRLEAIAWRVGQRLSLDRKPATHTDEKRGSQSSPRRVLHVATTVYEVGGHTRLIENWMKSDTVTSHSLVLLDQRHHKVRGELSDLVAASGGELLALPSGCSLLDRARRLRQTAQSGYDFVVLHHHPDDIVPTIAFAIPECPPVAIMNHADHVFWLGVSVADVVIDFREYGARISRERRGARSSMMFPLPIDLKTEAIGHAEARVALGIPSDEVVLLSIGAAYKYAPISDRNFFATLDKVLALNPAARLYVIGVNSDDLHTFGILPNDRVHALGPVNDPSLYEAAADLYLEGFPLNSYTAMLETVLRGVCPVLMYAPTAPLDLSGEAALRGLITTADDEDEYVARIGALIGDPIRRNEIAVAVAQRIAAINGVDLGTRYLQPLYEQLSALGHRPSLPPPSPGLAAEEDLDRVTFKGAHGIRIMLIDRPVQELAQFEIRDVLRVLLVSIRNGDTKLTRLHLRNWLGVLRAVAAGPYRSGEPRR